MKRTHKSVVYKMTHNVTGHFYYGSTNDIEKRIYAWQRAFATGRRIPKAVRNIVEIHGADFRFRVLKYVQESELLQVEERFIIKHINNPLCLNRRKDALAPARNLNRTATDMANKAKSLVGVNLKANIPVRSSVVTFEAPDGTVYTTDSVAKLSREHSLSQSSMNNLANGLIDQYKGWILSGTDRNAIGSRVSKLDITVVAPDGTHYEHVTNLNEFCKQHKVDYYALYHQAVGSPTGRPNTGYADRLGRRWYVKGKMRVYRVTDTKKLVYWENVTVLPKVADMLGISRSTMQRAAKSGKLVKKRYRIELMEDIV